MRTLRRLAIPLYVLAAAIAWLFMTFDISSSAGMHFPRGPRDDDWK